MIPNGGQTAEYYSFYKNSQLPFIKTTRIEPDYDIFPIGFLALPSNLTCINFGLKLYPHSRQDPFPGPPIT
jgi:hypothetical protein